jgi:hypothetical protein
VNTGLMSTIQFQILGPNHIRVAMVVGILEALIDPASHSLVFNAQRTPTMDLTVRNNGT